MYMYVDLPFLCVFFYVFSVSIHVYIPRSIRGCFLAFGPFWSADLAQDLDEEIEHAPGKNIVEN